VDKDPFGNLQEWGAVLEQLDELEQTDKLGDCQAGLIRILRFKGNWRLRETVLKSLAKIETPEAQLMEEVLHLIMDDNIYYEARILACEALQQIIKRLRLRQNGNGAIALAPIAAELNLLMKAPQPPIFFNAIDRCLQGMR